MPYMDSAVKEGQPKNVREFFDLAGVAPRELPNQGVSASWLRRSPAARRTKTSYALLAWTPDGGQQKAMMEPIGAIKERKREGGDGSSREAVRIEDTGEGAER